MKQGLFLNRAARRGMSIVEISAASIVLLVAFALLAQLMQLSARQERHAEARELAVRTVANELESMLALEWEQLVVGEAKPAKLPTEVRTLLPSAILTRQVIAGEDSLGKQLRVEIAWRDSRGQPVTPITLVAWKHREVREQQP